jgi:hypothetical protein
VHVRIPDKDGIHRKVWGGSNKIKEVAATVLWQGKRGHGGVKSSLNSRNIHRNAETRDELALKKGKRAIELRHF